MSRIPIRARLTLGFTVAMALVLLGTSALLYALTARALEVAVKEGLETRADTVGPRVAGGSLVAVSRNAPASDEGVAQILDASGAVVRAGNSSSGSPILTPAETGLVVRGEPLEKLTAVKGVDGRVRVLAVPVTIAGTRGVLVVGLSLGDRDEALRDLLFELALLEPIALLLAALLGFGLATAALRPVEAMRAEAEVVSAVEPGRRLPLPPADDEIRRLGETLNSMLDRLEEALEHERTFVADASHELRTPLSLLKTELELAARRPRTVEELERVLRSAGEETDRLAQLADDLLVLARRDAGGVPLRRTTVAVGPMLERLAARFSSRAALAGRQLEVVPTASELRVEADELRLEQAVGNLLANALVHGGGTIRLSAEADPLTLHVRDEGRGFPAEFLPRAFERFGRADEGRTGRGSGLGLAIVRVIAEAHGGSAHVANLEGGGADAWIVLPLDPD